MDKFEFSLRLIKNFVDKIKSPDFLYDENNKFYYEINGNVVTIDYNCNSMYIQKNGNDIFLTFDMLQKIHGVKCISGYDKPDTVSVERYEHGIPHGQWDCDSKYEHIMKTYNKGILEGPFRFSNRTHKIKGNFKNNKYHGVIEYYVYEEGEYVPEKNETYENGVLKNIINLKVKSTGIEIPLVLRGRDKLLKRKF